MAIKLYYYPYEPHPILALCVCPVVDSPRWQEYSLKKFAGRLHESATLVCRVLAVPAPQFYWQMRGGNITTSTSHQISSTNRVTTMTLASVRVSDYDAYTCVAVNIVSRSSFTLRLYEPGRLTGEHVNDRGQTTKTGSRLATFLGYSNPYFLPKNM